jgi:hypothetical protein
MEQPSPYGDPLIRTSTTGGGSSAVVGDDGRCRRRAAILVGAGRPAGVPDGDRPYVRFMAVLSFAGVVLVLGYLNSACRWVLH